MMLQDFFKAAGSDLLFRSREKGQKDAALPVSVTDRVTKEQGPFHAVTTRFSFAGGKGERTVVTDGEHVAFLTDRFLFGEPRCLYTSFDLPAGDGFFCNVADKNRLVFRDRATGIKFFRLLSATDNEDALEKNGLLMPDRRLLPGAIRVTAYAGLYRFGLEQTDHYIFVHAPENEIRAWHIKTNDGYEVSDPNKVCRFRIRADRGAVTLSIPDGESIAVSLSPLK